MAYELPYNGYDAVSPIVGPLSVFLEQTVLMVGKLIVAYIIWLIGKWLIELAVKGLNLLDVKSWNLDDRAREIIKRILVPTAKIILFLIILDTLGIGSNVVGALISGLAYAIAIAVGLAFGRALEPDAQRAVDVIHTNFKRTQ